MMRSRTWKRVLAAVCAGVAAVSMAACGGGTNSTAKDGVIINSVMNSTSQASLNYNPFSSTALTGVVGALYEPLFYMNKLKEDPTKLEPLMATRPSHFTMNRMTPIEMRHTIMKIAQQYPIGMALYISGPIHNRRLPTAVAPSHNPWQSPKRCFGATFETNDNPSGEINNSATVSRK